MAKIWTEKQPERIACWCDKYYTNHINRKMATFTSNYSRKDRMQMRFWEFPCVVCNEKNYCSYMEEKEDGFYCEGCAALPAFSEKLYKAVLSFQRLFRAHLAAKSVPCPSCSKECLALYESYPDLGPICRSCCEEEQEKRQCSYCYEERCRCDDGEGWCEKCESPFGNCICAELKYEHELELTRGIHHCGDALCKWNCGILRCGCIDICRSHHCDRDD